MALALFDLDNTLLTDDSDRLWGHFLGERGIVDPQTHGAANERFYRDYVNGELDIHAFLRFALAPLADNDPADLERWRGEFIRGWIEPVIAEAAPALIETHHRRGDTLAIVTATNRFVTEPIARLLGVPHLLATEPEWRDGRYTGDYVGTPTFRDGKIRALERWLRDRSEDWADSCFYSDSANDLPLLRRVARAVAVDPDATLDAAAREAGWERLTLRRGQHPVAMPD